MDEYKIRLVKGRVYELGSVGADGSAVRYPLHEFGKKKKNKIAALKIASTLDHVDEIGIERAVEKKLIKRLEDDMVEIRVGGETIRAYCFHRRHGYELVIVGIEGETHRGGSTTSSVFIKKYRPLVEAARHVVETEGPDRNVH